MDRFRRLSDPSPHRYRGILSRLSRDVRGNTLAIMAAMLFPLAGLVGGGIDVARMYITKTRLQHACDAGALAGRKAMGGGTWSQSSYAPRTTANQFFTGNFNTGAYGSHNTTVAFTENTGRVAGQASVVLPMTLMQIFGFSEDTIAVTCDAEMKLPNTDVMFVLDTTGSMANAAPGGGGTKMDVLRSAVKCFYETVARLDTSENCPNGNPSGGVSPDIQVRFGFVPFGTNVNVGYLLPSNWFADSWPYQSREQATIYGTRVSWNLTQPDRNASAWSGWTNTSRTAPALLGICLTALVPSIDIFADTGTPSWPDEDSQVAAALTNTPSNWTGYAPYLQSNYQVVKVGLTCQEQVRTRTIERNALWLGLGVTASTPGARPFPAWTYKQVMVDLRSLKSGTGWNTSFQLPIGDNHTNQTIRWDGCIEERKTVRQTSYQPIPSGARDLDIDAVPSASDPDSLWAPVLQDVIHMRRTPGLLSGVFKFQPNSGDMTLNTVTTFTQAYAGASYNCAVPARRMAVWSDASTYESYVNTLTPGGNTYHDIGLLWGARLLSPTGLFAAANATTPRGGDIQRNLIFMTDGDACTDPINYQAYGLAWYDRRTTDPATPPRQNQSCSHDSSPSELTNQVDARTAALCSAIKNKNIALWVIYFPDAGAVYPKVEQEMSDCATDAQHFYPARNSTSLKQAFADIAAQISQLRLTQ